MLYRSEEWIDCPERWHSIRMFDLPSIGITYADNYTGYLEYAFPVFYDRFTSVFKALDMTCNTSHILRYEACTTAFKGLE